MRAPVKSLLAVGGAFAAGVAVTAAYVAPRPGSTDVRQGMAGGTPDAVSATKREAPAPKAAHLSDAGPASGAWTDPVRPGASDAAAGAQARPARPPLVFSLDRRRSDDAAAPVSMAAPIPPPRRPSASDLLARRDGTGDPAVTTDRNIAQRPTDPASPSASPAPRQLAGAPRRTGSFRATPRGAEQDDARVAERSAKRLVAVRRIEPDMASDDIPPRRTERFDRYERDVADRPPVYRRRITSAEPGGILRWLDQP
jgi:hypothetical protein